MSDQTKERKGTNESKETEEDNYFINGELDDIDDRLLDKISDSENKIVIDDNLIFHCGDLEKKKIFLCDKSHEILWISPPHSSRKVFLEILVKRVSAIDNVLEQYRMKFEINSYWICTANEYKTYYKHLINNTLSEWQPLWSPRYEFQNGIELHSLSLIPYDPPKIQNFKLSNKNIINIDSSSSSSSFSNKKCKFISCKLECDITFAEELELQSFPFDCQDLSCSIIENSTSTKCEFIPLITSNLKFATIDPKYSIIDEWDLESALLEFGRFDNDKARIVLRLKMKRRYFAILLNIVIPMCFICGLSLTSFALNAESELGDRLNLLITLILTIVAFQYIVFEKLPNVAYLTYIDKYVLVSYSFLSALMIENAFGRIIGEELDKEIFMKLFISLFIIYQLIFTIYAIYVRQDEIRKLDMNSDEVEDQVNFERVKLHFDYTTAKQNDIEKNKNTMKYTFTALAPKF